MLWDVEDAWGRVKTIEDLSVCEVDTLLSAGALGASLSAGVVSMDWGFVPPKQMHDELRATMQPLRLSGPATAPVKVPIKSAASKQIGTRPKLAALVQCIVVPRMTPPLPSGGVGVDKTLASEWETSVGEYETHRVVSSTRERRHRFVEVRPSAIRRKRRPCGKKEEPSALMSQQRTVINQLEREGVNTDLGVVRGERNEEHPVVESSAYAIVPTYTLLGIAEKEESAWRSEKGGHRSVESDIAWDQEEKKNVTIRDAQ